MPGQNALKTLLFMSACVLVLLMLMSAPQARSQALVCKQGGLHLVTDLKGGDLPEHQTTTTPAFTCYAASMPTCGGTPLAPGANCLKPGMENSNQSGNYSCPTGMLHLVSDLKGGVEAKHQTGTTPPYTCIAGSLPSNTCTGNDIAQGNPPVCKACNECNGNYLFCAGIFANGSHTACYTPRCPAGMVLTPFNLSGKCVQCTGNTYASFNQTNGVPQCLQCNNGWSPNSDNSCCGPQGACLVQSGSIPPQAGCSCGPRGCPTTCTR
jgi:hypothetical protein